MADAYWRIEFDGQVYREGDLTIGQVERIEKTLGVTWRSIHPLRSAQQAKAILSVLVADVTGITEDAAGEKVSAVKASEFFDMVSVEDDDLPVMFENGNPPKADELSTDT